MNFGPWLRLIFMVIGVIVTLYTGVDIGYAAIEGHDFFNYTPPPVIETIQSNDHGESVKQKQSCYSTYIEPNVLVTEHVKPYLEKASPIRSVQINIGGVTIRKWFISLEEQEPTKYLLKKKNYYVFRLDDKYSFVTNLRGPLSSSNSKIRVVAIDEAGDMSVKDIGTYAPPLCSEWDLSSKMQCLCPKITSNGNGQ